LALTHYSFLFIALQIKYELPEGCISVMAMLMQKPKVVIIKGKDAEQMVEKSLSFLGGIKQVICPGDVVLVKPNLTAVWPGMNPGVVTNTRIVRSIISLAQGVKAGEVIVGEGSGGADTEEAYEISGIKEIAREFGVRLLDFNKEESIEVICPEWKVLKKIRIAKVALESDVIINLPVLKTTHPPFFVTLGMKNMMGVLPGKGIYYDRYFSAEYLANKGFWEATGEKKIIHDSGKLSQAVVDLNIALKADLTIVDGIVGLEDGGPVKGSSIEMNLIITGMNPVAVDAVSATIMGFNPAKINYLRFAAKQGLGPCNLNDIDVVGETISDIQRKFKPYKP